MGNSGGVSVHWYTCAGVYVCEPSVRDPLNVWPPLKWVRLPGSASPPVHQREIKQLPLCQLSVGRTGGGGKKEFIMRFQGT